MNDLILLDDVLTYARCPLEWYWEKRAGVQKPGTPEQLAPRAIQQAIAFYYEGHADSLGAAVGLVWKDWCDAWGGAGILADLARYEQGRAEILRQFERGNITRPDGTLYYAPHLTNEYRSRMFNAGLLKVGRRLDEFAAGLGLALPEARSGSAFGDAFADCVLIADRMTHPPAGRGSGLPAREVVLGWQAPYQVNLGDRVRLAGQADLLLRAPATAGANDEVEDPRQGAVVLEVHDYRLPRATVGTVARNLRVIAASLAESRESALGASVKWRTVDHVVCRHMRSGETFVIRQTNPGRLLAVVAAAGRGMRSQIVIPRLLTGGEDCRACAYRERCFGETGWDTLDFVDPTAAARSERLLAVVQRVGETLAGDDRAAARLREALTAIGQEVQREMPDIVGAFEVLAEVMHALPSSGDR